MRKPTLARPPFGPPAQPLARALTEVRGGLSLANYGTGNPIYIAHRGGALMYPEETAEGYAAARSAGVRVLECDVQLLSDAGLAVMHDTTVDRVTTSTGNVSAFTTAGFKALAIDANTWHGSNFGNALTPMLLSEFIDGHRGAAILVPEAKVTGAGEAIVNALQAAGVSAAQAIVQSFLVAELSPAVTAGYPALYLNDGSGDIAATQAAGVTWVGLNHETATDVQIGNWLAAGFKVVMYTVNRHFRRDQLLALGVHGFFTDDPQYLAASSALATSDSFATGTWSPGIQNFADAMDAPNRGRFFESEYWGFGETATSFALHGWACPIKGDANADDYSIDLKVRMDAGTGWASIFFANNDRPFGDGSTTHSADLVGYHCLMRQNGTVQIYKRSESSTTSLVSQTGTTIAAGQEVAYRLTVTPTSITLARLNGDGSVNYSTTTTDTSYRGGYIHLGRSGLNCKFRDVSVS